MRFYSGLPETLCGRGSMVETTQSVRQQLREVLDRCGARSLLDAPCGDFNWLREVNLTGIAYTGVDVSMRNIERARLNAPDKEFRVLDILEEDLPTADAVMCRDFLQHIPDRMVSRVLGKLRRFPVLIATSYCNSENVEMDPARGFRRLNLQAAPFNLGPPSEIIVESADHVLGVWT